MFFSTNAPSVVKPILLQKAPGLTIFRQRSEDFPTARRSSLLYRLSDQLDAEAPAPTGRPDAQ